MVPLRQWVLSVPFALRVRLAADPAMLNAVSRVLWEEMRRWYRGVSGVARGGDVRVEAAAITFVQRFGGALNLNVHFHVVTADGVWRCLPASVVIGAKDAAGRERLLRYVARPAVALDRVSELPDGRIAWRLKQPGGRGETHRIMEPMDFMARLVALIPPPRHPLVRYHGVFAPNSPWRPAVVPGPRPEELTRAATPRATTAPAADATQVTGRDGPAACEAGCETALTVCPRRKVSSRIAWATLLHRVWGWDVLQCPRCDGRMKVIALIRDREVVVKILTHMGLSAAEIVPAPPRRWDDTS